VPDAALTLVPTPPVRDRTLASLFRIPAELARVFWAARFADVITLHCGAAAIESRGAAVALIARLWRKLLVIRTFGGVDFRTQAGFVARSSGACFACPPRLGRFPTRKIAAFCWFSLRGLDRPGFRQPRQQPRESRREHIAVEVLHPVIASRLAAPGGEIWIVSEGRRHEKMSLGKTDSPISLAALNVHGPMFEEVVR